MLMLLTALLTVALAALLPRSAVAASSPYFTLSTYKTFSPDEKPKLHLYTRNESELEFRVYRVQDPVKFVSGLAEMHSFGTPEHLSPTEQVDEKSLLERFHDWKNGLWYDVKQFLREQFSPPTRDALKTKQSGLTQRSRILNAAQFAQIPLLNDKQLVARWSQELPSTFVSDNQVLPVDALGSGMYLVEATDGHLKAYTLLMVSRTALVTRTVAGQVVAYVVDRKSGAPVAGAQVVLNIQGQPHEHTASADGVVTFNAGESATGAKSKPTGDDAPAAEADDGGKSKTFVMARRGDDIALVAPWYSAFTQQNTERYAAYTYTDRPVYRPGHTVHFRSILRQREGDALILPKATTAHVTITDSEQKTLFDRNLPFSSFGSVQGELTLPANASLDFDRIEISVGDRTEQDGSASFRVEEYRKPEYQVKVSTAHARVLEGESNTANIEARYFFGEPVAGAKVKYRVYQSSHYWWGDPAADDDSGNGTGLNATSSDESSSAEDGPTNDESAGDQNSETEAKLNADGKLAVNIPTRFVEKEHNDLDYVVEAGVTDEAGREMTARYRFLATYGSFRIHVEPVSYNLTQGQPAQFRVTAVDYDERPVQTRVHLRLTHLKSSQRGLITETINVGEVDTTTGADGSAVASVPVNVKGDVSVTATANTPEHRTVQDDTYVYVSGSGESTEDDESGSAQVRIIADKKSYAPGDTAHLTLISQVQNLHALVTATGYTAEFQKVLSSGGKTLQFNLPITRDSQPNLTVDVAFIVDDKLYQARRSLQVPPAQQQLQISITPAAEVFQPGQAASYDVVTRDWKGNPVAAELSFGVVDEAIYALYPDSSGDMLSALYPQRPVYPDLDSSLTYYFTGEAGTRSPLLAERHSRYRPQLAQVKPGNDAKAPRVRKSFPDTALWQPQVRTDSSGHARVTLNYPDSLTTWRATVRVITMDSRAGATVNRVLVRKNLIVRMGQPRFLRKGDSVTVPVIVHNYLQTEKQVTVSLNATGADVVSGGPQQVTIAPKAEATVNYHLRASVIGMAKLTAKAISTEESDALEISLPVEPAGVKEILAASGRLNGGASGSAEINFPAGTDPDAHLIRLDVSPSIAGSLFAGLDYLSSFPYGCTEQTMSSFLPNIIIARAMQKLNVPVRTDPKELDERIDAGFKRLQDYHHADGGWGWWKEDQSQIFMTSYVVSGLAEAKAAGYDQSGSMIGDGAAFLQKQLEQHPRMLPELRAYAVYALALAGQNNAKQLDLLYGRRNDLSPQALAYAGLALQLAHDNRAGEMATLLEGKAHVQGEVASWTSSRNNLLDIDYDESAATTAFAMKFLIHQRPQSPLIPKAAQWLVANRTQGEWWGSTQDTAFVIFGLTDYLTASQELNADLNVEVEVNGQSAGKRHFTREDALRGETLHIEFDAKHLQGNGNSVRVVTQGTGKAYWAAQGEFYSTARASLQRGTMQLNVTRDYFVLAPEQLNGHLVYRLQPLHGAVSQGDVLAVHLGVSGSPQKYLLIEDPIPSGTEFLQHSDGYTILDRPSTWEDWFTRQEFHDDRAAIFATTFEGRHESFYLLKVVSPGSFEISPARVAPMYQPGVQATTDPLHLDVKEVAR